MAIRNVFTHPVFSDAPRPRKRGLIRPGVLLALTVLLLVAAFPGSAFAAGTTTRVSVDSAGIQGNGNGANPSISADGRRVAFYSVATNLVSGDTNGVADVFVRDTATNTTIRVSVSSGGAQGNGVSNYPAISSDGRYVTFSSTASNLVTGDTNGLEDVFVRDIQTGTTTRVSMDGPGVQGNGASTYPSISSDGRYVAFNSAATNLVSGDTNGQTDVFVRDTQTNTTTRVSMDGPGVQGNGISDRPSISGDGRYVAFRSAASNLVTGDTNGVTDIFLRDTQTNTTTRLSLTSGGSQGNGATNYPSISTDGRYVAFESDATNLIPGDSNAVRDVFVRDRATNTTIRVSVDSAGVQGNGISTRPVTSYDGRYVAFASVATNLVSDDTNGRLDMFVRDTQANTTTRVSLGVADVQGDGATGDTPSISANGRYVAFDSLATNLVSGDTNGVRDVFVRDTNDPPPVSTPASSGWTIALLLVAGLAVMATSRKKALVRVRH